MNKANDAERATLRFFLSITEAGRSLFRAFLNGARTPERFAKARSKVRAFANTEAAKIEADVSRMPEPQRTQLTKACRAGCAHCCYFRVGVEAHEMAAIGHHIHHHFSEEERAALRKRTAAYREQMPPLTVDKLLGRAPCPFLVDDQCSIYEIRPFVCQRHHSVNLQACEKSRFDPKNRPNIPFVMPHIHMVSHLMLGMRKEILDAGLDTSIVELGRAVEAVLDHPDAFDKYFAGEDIFAESRMEVPRPVEIARPEDV